MDMEHTWALAESYKNIETRPRSEGRSAQLRARPKDEALTSPALSLPPVSPISLSAASQEYVLTRQLHLLDILISKKERQRSADDVSNGLPPSLQLQLDNLSFVPFPFPSPIPLSADYSLWRVGRLDLLELQVWSSWGLLQFPERGVVGVGGKRGIEGSKTEPSKEVRSFLLFPGRRRTSL